MWLALHPTVGGTATLSSPVTHLQPPFTASLELVLIWRGPHRRHPPMPLEVVGLPTRSHGTGFLPPLTDTLEAVPPVGRPGRRSLPAKVSLEGWEEVCVSSNVDTNERLRGS